MYAGSRWNTVANPMLISMLFGKYGAVQPTLLAAMVVFFIAKILLLRFDLLD